MEIDEVGILRVPKIMKTFQQDEFLQLSMKLVKTNEYGNQHNRYFVLTNKRILLLNKQSIRRKVPLSYLIAITLSVRSFEFILHFKDVYDDDDLRLVSERRSKVVENIVKTFSTEFNQQLASFSVQDLNLKRFVTYKQDRRKNLKKMPTENVKFLFYKPILEENQRKSQLQKVHQTLHHNKQLFALRKEEQFDLNDFNPIKILFEGSVAQIVMVEHNQTKIQYAMKCISKTDCVQLDLSNFTNLNNYQTNPFLVKLEFCYESESKFFFIQQLMKCDLFTKMEEVHHLEENKVRFYAVEILLALEHIHQKNLVYCDLKPENILLDAINHACLCDFGMMRAKMKGLNGVYITPEYMPPETLINYQNQLYYSDYWQLGILLYELTFSHPPFMSNDQELLFDFILNCQLEFPEQIQISEEFKDLLRKVCKNIYQYSQLLKKEPKERLGYNGGVPEIQSHIWFKNVNWKLHYDKVIQPPEWRSPNLMELQKKQKKSVTIQS